MTYNITKHCRKRYIERVLGGLNSSSNLLLDILKDLKNGRNITSKISEEYPRFILYIKQRYGYKGYTFITNNHVIYILTKRKDTEKLYDVVTCYQIGDSLNKFSNSTLSKEEIFIRLSMLKKDSNE